MASTQNELSLHCIYTGTLGTATAPYHKGRTGTHEVGHWLTWNRYPGEMQLVVVI